MDKVINNNLLRAIIWRAKLEDKYSEQWISSQKTEPGPEFEAQLRKYPTAKEENLCSSWSVSFDNYYAVPDLCFLFTSSLSESFY